ncbi:MAG: hypothetical protein KFF50_02880 [Desulfatitalea sp.]|nr:hypothetical protein [Desulfatitalea sp.]
MTYTCKRCGALANAPGHLCQPCNDRQKCRFCGRPDSDRRHVCKSKLEEMRYVCNGCGRIATDAELLCRPEAIG